MAQRPKDRVRRAILDSAAEELARAGHQGATLASIAARAGTSIGNLYKYFPNKDALFHVVVPPAFVRELGDLLERRIQALGAEVDVARLGAGHRYRLASEELLRFALAHRAHLLFLLVRAEGSVYASFPEDLVRSLTRAALGYALRAYPTAKMTAPRRRALARIYRAFLGAIASVLADEGSERARREAVEHLTTYHLAGLRAFFDAAAKPESPRHP